MADKQTTNITSTSSKKDITSFDGNPPSVGRQWEMNDISREIKSTTCRDRYFGEYCFRDDTTMYDTKTESKVFFSKDHYWDGYEHLWKKGTQYDPKNLRLIGTHRASQFSRSILDEMVNSSDEMPGTFPGTNDQYKWPF
ncbi:hypothetical protein V866_002777 [Kwoniella sp. B9012]